MRAWYKVLRQTWRWFLGLFAGVSIMVVACHWIGRDKGATLTGHKEAVTSLSFSPDGRTLASSSYDGTVKLWNPGLGRLITSLNGYSSGVLAVSFSPDGKLLATASDADTTVFRSKDGAAVRAVTDPRNKAKVKIWKLNNLNFPTFLYGHRSAVTCLAFSPDGNILATGSYDGEIVIWNLATGGEKIRLSCKREGPNSLAFSPDGRALASACGGEVIIWDISSGTTVAVLQGHKAEVLCVAFAPDGKLLASGSTDGTVKLWGVATGELRATLACQQQEAAAICFSPNGRLLAIGSREVPEELPEFFQPKGRLQLLKVQAGENCIIFTVHQGGITCLAFSPDGKIIASGGQDGNIKLWKVAGCR